MVDYAVTWQGSDRRIEWRQAVALDLPFEDASFDVVCCQFGAMFFPNRVAGYAEARRVLRPGGAEDPLARRHHALGDVAAGVHATADRAGLMAAPAGL